MGVNVLLEVGESSHSGKSGISVRMMMLTVEAESSKQLSLFTDKISLSSLGEPLFSYPDFGFNLSSSCRVGLPDAAGQCSCFFLTQLR